MKNVHVVAAILIDNQKVFCCQRKDSGPLARKWEFPGGKIEIGETKEEALIREIKEELNTQIKIKDFYMTVRHQYESFHLVMDTYICEIVYGGLELKEHMDAKWVEKDYLEELDWAEADFPVIKELKKMLN